MRQSRACGLMQATASPTLTLIAQNEAACSSAFRVQLKPSRSGLLAGTGNVKSDSFVSQDWNDVGGSVYGAYRFGPAALTASALY